MEQLSVMCLVQGHLDISCWARWEKLSIIAFALIYLDGPGIQTSNLLVPAPLLTSPAQIFAAGLEIQAGNSLVKSLLLH